MPFGEDVAAEQAWMFRKIILDAQQWLDLDRDIDKNVTCCFGVKLRAMLNPTEAVNLVSKDDAGRRRFSLVMPLTICSGSYSRADGSSTSLPPVSTTGLGRYCAVQVTGKARATRYRLLAMDTSAVVGVV